MSDKYGAMHHAGNTGRAKTLSHETGKARGPSSNSILIVKSCGVTIKTTKEPLLPIMDVKLFLSLFFIPAYKFCITVPCCNVGYIWRLVCACIYVRVSVRKQECVYVGGRGGDQTAYI